MARLARNGGYIVGKGRVIDRMHTGCHTGTGGGLTGQSSYQGGMGCLTTDGGTIFTVQRHIKDAGTKFFGHFSLQLQAFAHPHFDAAVMVTDGQKTGLRLRTKENVAGMGHKKLHTRPEKSKAQPRNTHRHPGLRCQG